MARNDYDPNYKLSNREKAQIPKKCKFWCMKCDGALVGQWGKCPGCGYVNWSKKKKQKD